MPNRRMQLRRALALRKEVVDMSVWIVSQQATALTEEIDSDGKIPD